MDDSEPETHQPKTLHLIYGTCNNCAVSLCLVSFQSHEAVAGAHPSVGTPATGALFLSLLWSDLAEWWDGKMVRWTF